MLRPVAITFLAPMYFAIWTARRPAVPVAPFTSTVSPASSFARSFMAAHADMPGLPIAAAVTSSSPSGNATHCPDLTTVLSDMLPSGGFGRTKYTRRPSSRRPTPSIPTTNGRSAEEL
jgi:hypothetical protein